MNSRFTHAGVLFAAAIVQGEQETVTGKVTFKTTD
jgi:hypothetical protein